MRMPLKYTGLDKDMYCILPFMPVKLPSLAVGKKTNTDTQKLNQNTGEWSWIDIYKLQVHTCCVAPSIRADLSKSMSGNLSESTNGAQNPTNFVRQILKAHVSLLIYLGKACNPGRPLVIKDRYFVSSQGHCVRTKALRHFCSLRLISVNHENIFSSIVIMFIGRMQK